MQVHKILTRVKFQAEIFDNWLIVWDEWLDLLIYDYKLFSFLYGLYATLLLLIVISKKSTL